jgi:hypothetical protein
LLLDFGSGFSAALTLQIYASAILLLQNVGIKKYELGMAYSAIMLIPDFIKPHPTDRELNYMDRQAYR